MVLVMVLVMVAVVWAGIAAMEWAIATREAQAAQAALVAVRQERLERMGRWLWEWSRSF